MANEVDRLLHDADRKVLGANMARMMGDGKAAARMDRDAAALYKQALEADPQMVDPAWMEDGNREAEWLKSHGFQQIAAVSHG